MPLPSATLPPHRPLRRRLVGIVALVTAAALTSCGADAGTATSSAGSPAPSSEGTGWTFTDDLGATVTLDETPTRVAGLTDIVSSLWSYGIESVATFGYTALEDDSSFDDKDVSEVAQVGQVYGEIDLEALLAAEPDLVVTHVYPPDGDSSALTPDSLPYGFADDAQLAAVREIAPVVAIEMAGTADDVVDRTLELVESLGVDLDSPGLTRAEADYDAAAERLSAAAASGLTVMAEAAYAAEGLYVAKASDDPSLAYYAELGVHIPDPGGEDYFWEVVSWERVADHSTDVVLNSTRAMSEEELLAQPTFAALPAAAAGQVFDWNSQNMDWFAQTRTMNDLAGWLESSEKVT